MNNLQLIEKVLYYIDEHICEELTYERLADEFEYYDEDNFKYFGGYRRPHDWNEEVENKVEASRVKGFKGKREYPWVVTYQGKVIGQIQLFNFSKHNTCADLG